MKTATTTFGRVGAMQEFAYAGRRKYAGIYVKGGFTRDGYSVQSGQIHRDVTYARAIGGDAMVYGESRVHFHQNDLVTIRIA